MALKLLDHISLSVFEVLYVITVLVTLYSLVFCSAYQYVACVCVLYVCLKLIRQKSTGKLKVKGQGVFITGCDTGFGHDLSHRLDNLGFTVFAGCLRPDGKGAALLKSKCSKRLHVVPLDVSKDESIQQAHEYVVQHLPKSGLWAIVSNAGFNVMGDVEWLTVNLYKKVMDVNFYGAVRMIRNFLYLVRKSKGRVVIVTSVKGLYSWPANSAYHVTKHGLETMTDSLRLEMLKFNVKVSLVEPGNFSTATACQNSEHFTRYEQEADEMWTNASADVRAAYGGRSYLDTMIETQRTSISGSADTTEPVVNALEDAILSDRPHTRYLVDGGTYAFDRYTTLARYYNFLPTWLSDWIIVKMTKCDHFINENVKSKKNK